MGLISLVLVILVTFASLVIMGRSVVILVTVVMLVTVLVIWLTVLVAHHLLGVILATLVTECLNNTPQLVNLNHVFFLVNQATVVRAIFVNAQIDPYKYNNIICHEITNNSLVVDLAIH